MKETKDLILKELDKTLKAIKEVKHDLYKLEKYKNELLSRLFE